MREQKQRFTNTAETEKRGAAESKGYTPRTKSQRHLVSTRSISNILMKCQNWGKYLKLKCLRTGMKGRLNANRKKKEKVKTFTFILHGEMEEIGRGVFFFMQHVADVQVLDIS